MPCIEITEADFDDMHHALGRPSDPLVGTYRNVYVTEIGSETAKRFEATGLWDLAGTMNGGRDAVFSVNLDGRGALADWLKLKRLAENTDRGTT